MAFEGRVQVLSQDIEQETTLIADNIEIPRIAPLVNQNFNRNEAVELEITDIIPTITTLFWKSEISIEDPNRVRRLFAAITDNYRRFVNQNFPSVRSWTPDIEIVSFEQNNLFFRWRAKTGNVNLADQLENMFNTLAPIISVQAGVRIDPLSKWEIGNIALFNTTEEGVALIRQREIERRGVLERLLNEIGNLTSSRIVGIPTILWITAGIIIIPEITRTIRSITD